MMLVWIINLLTSPLIGCFFFIQSLQGFLALEGELTPILVQMVKSANMNGLLDNENQSLKLHTE